MEQYGTQAKSAKQRAKKRDKQKKEQTKRILWYASAPAGFAIGGYLMVDTLSTFIESGVFIIPTRRGPDIIIRGREALLHVISAVLISTGFILGAASSLIAIASEFFDKNPRVSEYSAVAWVAVRGLSLTLALLGFGIWAMVFIYRMFSIIFL